ncbi:hypothetical protein [Actinokineospora sp. HUAS TT18]|uniref:hypothetical protein n=1 Tax=Actinokineospora sp. HUAS TT18 TaxID=3447451 RepID=UPI003F521429
MTGRQFPGIGTAITSEIDRLRDLRDTLAAAADRLGKLDQPTWSGSAADAYAAFVGRLRLTLLRASDEHDHAARAVERFEATRAEVQHRFGHVPDADLDRLTAQAAAEGDLSAAAVRRAVEALAGLPELFDDPAETTAAPVARTELARLRASAPEHAVDPRTSSGDVARYRDSVRALVTDVLASVFEPVSD